MKTNFFETDCKEYSRTNALFGLCDKEDNSKAYSTLDTPDKWIATVVNNENKTIIFTPIDNCIEILKEGTNQKESTCDGMLTFENTIYLVELKNQRTQWQNKAIQQLENTMRLLLESQDLDKFKYKKAFACNKKHPNFVTIDNERNKRFFKNYGFRIDLQAKIIIK